MAALDFPASPVDGQVYGNYVWDDTIGVWKLLPESMAAPVILETEEKTTAYTLALADAGKIVQMNASGAVNVTVPTNSSAPFPVGTIIGVYNRSSSNATVVRDSGVTVRNAGPISQYGEASLRKRATDEWVMVGG